MISIDAEHPPRPNPTVLREKSCISFIFLFFFLNFQETPPDITVDLKDAAKDAQGYRKGIYILGPNKVNGKHHWIQEGGSNALWYSPSGLWKIGPKDSLGKDMAGILSSDGSAGPLEANTWKYYNGDKWIDCSDMITLSSNLFESFQLRTQS